jgi:hypothetical protein
MKKIILLVAFALLGTTVTFAQDIAKTKTEVKKTKKVKATATKTSALAKVEGAGMVFETETIDYGKMFLQTMETNR